MQVKEEVYLNKTCVQGGININIKTVPLSIQHIINN